MKVNIYTAATIRKPNRGKGSAMYLIECVINDRIETREGTVYYPDTTEDSVILAALIMALCKFNKSCELRIFTKCMGVFNALDTGRALKYREKDFTSSRKTMIRNAELWDILIELLQKHKWEITQDDHSYMNYMESTLKKAHKDRAGA